MFVSGVSGSDRSFHPADVDLLKEKSPSGYRSAQRGQQVWTLGTGIEIASCVNGNDGINKKNKTNKNYTVQ